MIARCRADQRGSDGDAQPAFRTCQPTRQQHVGVEAGGGSSADIGDGGTGRTPVLAGPDGVRLGMGRYPLRDRPKPAMARVHVPSRQRAPFGRGKARIELTAALEIARPLAM